jgi:hypothetical protein
VFYLACPEAAVGCCRPCVAGFVAFFIAQSLKVFTHWYTEAKWDFTQVMRSGGMPSSHTACVSCEQNPTTTAVAGYLKLSAICQCCMDAVLYAGCWSYRSARDYSRHRYRHLCHRSCTVSRGKCFVYTLMLRTLFAPLGLTEDFHETL